MIGGVSSQRRSRRSSGKTASYGKAETKSTCRTIGFDVSRVARTSKTQYSYDQHYRDKHMSQAPMPCRWNKLKWKAARLLARTAASPRLWCKAKSPGRPDPRIRERKGGPTSHSTPVYKGQGCVGPDTVAALGLEPPAPGSAASSSTRNRRRAVLANVLQSTGSMVRAMEDSDGPMGQGPAGPRP